MKIGFTGRCRRRFFREVEERFQGTEHLREDLLRSFLELIREKRDVCQIFSTGGIDPNSAMKIFSLPGLKEKYDEVLPAELDEKQSEYYLEFFYNGGYAVVRKWIDSGFSDSIDTIIGMPNTIRSRCLS